jgi:hypothetical protein
MTSRETRKLAFGERGNALEIQRFSLIGLGQSEPQRYPHSSVDGEPSNEASVITDCRPLGPPLSIREVAGLFGCSIWTVRQSYLPQGLPYLRTGPHSKLIFFREQVIQWILQHQQKGGAKR